MRDSNVKCSNGMHVVDDGPRNAQPLLLIHGSGASGATWGPMVPLLTRTHRVVRVDLPGCGQSPPTSSFAVPAQAREVAAVLDEIGLRAVTVAGHSSGGYVATALAEQRPDLVGAVALVSSGPSMAALRSAQPFLLRALTEPPLGPIVWRLRSDKVIRKGMRAAFVVPAPIPDNAVADFRAMTFRTFHSVLRANGAYLDERSLPERLAVLGLPVLAVFGDADPKWRPASVHDYETVPGVRIEILPGVGHVPILEAPEATSGLLRDFAAAQR
ncbi:alpha/beta fold hydrolase [Nocardia mexicana]|uniref:Pimeloyl-ACP methyl ester carboxylesterase n=1 Tax=Nocardia mexicana TaxID=279262 RepID=A0A370GDY3_9NOCA|nr:alpha/beta fold hydrolase [Nocardia mexicana]RDI42002.1 pimeloyl-ACP methyl ester carboxylesterase [Nocardia mexicana]